MYVYDNIKRRNDLPERENYSDRLGRSCLGSLQFLVFIPSDLEIVPATEVFLLLHDLLLKYAEMNSNVNSFPSKEKDKNESR